MRGAATRQIIMLLGVTPDQEVPQDHPIRRIKPIVEQALRVLSPTFARMYAAGGRPSIPPEHLLKASLLIALLEGTEVEWLSLRSSCQSPELHPPVMGSGPECTGQGPSGPTAICHPP